MSAIIDRSAKDRRLSGVRAQSFQLRIDELRKLLPEIWRWYGDHAVFEPKRNDPVRG